MRNWRNFVTVTPLLPIPEYNVGQTKSNLCDYICCSHRPLLYVNHFLSSVLIGSTMKFSPKLLSDMSTGRWLLPVHSPTYSGHYATMHAWTVQQGILRTPLPCLKTNRKMRLVLLPCVAVQPLSMKLQYQPSGRQNLSDIHNKISWLSGCTTAYVEGSKWIVQLTVTFPAQ